MTIEKSFYLRTFKTKHCWFWIGAKDKKSGYGSAYFNGKHIKAHRLSFLLHKGSVPRKMIIMHSCDNPSCVNPDHLMTGTHSENAIDSIKKGRAYLTPSSGKRMLCGKGHDISLDSQVYINKNNPKSGRMCRICKSKSNERRPYGKSESSKETSEETRSQEKIDS